MIQKFHDLDVVVKNKDTDTRDITTILLCTACVCVALVLLYLGLLDGRGI